MPDLELVLKDGTVLENCSAGYSGHFLWLYLKNISIQEATQIAFDQSKVETIVFNYGSLKAVYEGLTEVHAIIKQEDSINVLLTGEHVTEQKDLPGRDYVRLID